MDKFKNKYRIPSARAQWWDYGQNAAYFITICTAHRECYFGSIMQLSEMGKIAYNYWMEIPKHFPFVTLGEFVIMPNHVHGIVIIDKHGNERLESIQQPPVVDTSNLGVFIEKTPNFEKTPRLGVSTGGKNEQWHSGTVGVIINQYKRYCTIQIRKIHADFARQTRFHDRIIRNNVQYRRIENYIINNPLNWRGDKFYN
jgi:REP element-mobilizing transposase RayT